ncbi:MAG: U32 family peptidase [Bacteroidales bacterium]|nr:U32 family peptidase [Bacteroidales bacterium]MBQ5539942.1 U32 family peptidase [Bacteroidales bacterium]MBR4678705.1 U32 family peptidase [Bacteroidales bacterium]
MSPAGSFETLAAAVNAGAQAVYFGLGTLNMRAKSTVNFTEDDLKTIVEICQKAGVRSYLAINTIMYDEDLTQMRRLVDLAKENHVTAIIASDTSVLQYALEKGVEVHASTQLNISNVEAVKFFSKFCDVMVLARECSLDKVKHIHDEIIRQDIRGPKGELVRLEMFVHGALCMAVSGKCYLSLHQMNHSANRGACLQICRRGYEVTDLETGEQLAIENEYIMSPKDLCTIEFLDEILASGVEVLKIEGRARPPEYVKLTTQVYCNAVKEILEKTYTKEKAKADKEKLKDVFNRGFWNGYYLGQRLGEWTDMHGSKAKYHKEFIGVINNFFSKLSVAEIYLNSGVLKKGDTIFIVGQTTGVEEFEVTEIRYDLKPVDSAHKGQAISIPVPRLVRRGDKVYLRVENHL